MLSKTVDLAVLDTSVYIENFRTGRFTQRIVESPFLFRCVSVVIHELLRGARKPAEREFALALAANLRLYTPTERIWLDSGEIVARIAVAKGYDRRKIQELSLRCADCPDRAFYRSGCNYPQSTRLWRCSAIPPLSPPLLGVANV